MAAYFLGVDLGGSKTHALVADERGRALGFARGGPGSHEVVGYDGLEKVLFSATREALQQAGIPIDEVAGAGFGVAGYDWPAEREPTLQSLRTLGLKAPFEAVNDAVIGLLAGAQEGWGVAVVAGTGCNCWGWDAQRRIGRVTGCGYWMGESGGGSDTVAEAVRAISREWSLRGPRTRLTQTFLELTGARDSLDLLEGLNLGRYELSAAHAPYVFKLAAEGDEVAREIARWNGRGLSDLAVGVIRQLGFEELDFDVVLVGSLYDGSPELIQTMQAAIRAVAPGARLVRLKAPPVVGGALLGMEQAGIDPRPLRQTLIETTAEFIHPETAANHD